MGHPALYQRGPGYVDRVMKAQRSEGLSPSTLHLSIRRQSSLDAIIDAEFYRCIRNLLSANSPPSLAPISLQTIPFVDVDVVQGDHLHQYLKGNFSIENYDN